MIGISIATICSCGSKESNKNDGTIVVGSNGTEYGSYQECCAANDYEAAHLFLAKMENNGADEFLTAKDYVFKNEALYLMSMDDEKAKRRIVYLLKEEGNNNDHVAMLIDLAIENDDEAFVKTLGNQYTSGATDEDLKKLSAYLSSKKSEGNREFLMALFKKLDEEDLLLDLAIKNSDKAFILEYASNHLTLSNTALLNYLAAMKDKQLSEKILEALTEKENRIPNRPSLGFVIVHDLYGGNEISKEYSSFKNRIEIYNNYCRSILNIAISCKNNYLAQRVLQKFKSNISYKRIGGCIDNGSDYKWKVYTNNDDIVSSKATYQDAVRSGAFK